MNFKSSRELTAKELNIRNKHPVAHLVIPCMEFMSSYIDALKEGFFDYIEATPETLNNSVQAKIFLEKINSGVSWDTKNPDKSNPCHVFWLIENNIFLGRVRLKNLLTPFSDSSWNETNNFRGGHIGYSIAPKHRGKGLSILQLSLAIDKLQDLAPNLPVAFHTIDLLNKASIQTTLACGYSQHGSFTVKGNKLQVFVLPLNSNKKDIPAYPPNS